MARIGTPHCPHCDHPIQRQTPEQMVSSVLAMKEGRKLILLAPMVRGRKGAHLEAFQAVRRAGLIRARVDGEIVDLGESLPKVARRNMRARRLRPSWTGWSSPRGDPSLLGREYWGFKPPKPGRGPDPSLCP